MLSYAFVILEESGTACEFALDDIYYESGVVGLGDDIQSKGLATDFKLNQNDPIPFNPSTRIHYSLERAGQVDLLIFNLKGRLIKTLGFAYRIDLGPGPFILAGALALGIPLLTVSFRAARASVANPIDSLKYE